MFYIFEMANNHQGSVAHAKKIIDSFSELAKANNITAGIKLQLRDLDTFIHPKYLNSDLKFVKRFRDTRLTKEEFTEIVEYIKESGLKSIATPFDEKSVDFLNDLGIEIIKVASCSHDDWPLLKKIALVNKKIIISTGGAEYSTLDKVYDFFKKGLNDIAFLHCVGEYPTSYKNANLSRIKELQKRYTDIEIGFSTHESPHDKTLVPYAVTLGCTIVEKHVGVETEDIKLNDYSLTPEQFQNVLDEVSFAKDAIDGVSEKEKDTLRDLKRGVFFRNNKKAGEVIELDDVYFAFPIEPGQVDASMVDDEWGWVKRSQNVIGKILKKDIDKDAALFLDEFYDKDMVYIDENIMPKVHTLLQESKNHVTSNDEIEISMHYGLESFFEYGAVIITKINREYCKKLIVMLPEQKHPNHMHIQKEEAFELLSGDCTLELENTTIKLEIGVPVIIKRGTMHSFTSQNGCVIEEVSTAHILGDSVYEDPKINTLNIKDRKIKVRL